MQTYIDDEKINELLEDDPGLSEYNFQKLLERSESGESYSIEEMAMLIKYAANKKFRARILEQAEKIKKEIYGERIVLFAPFYVGNKCINKCKYCAFQSSNKNIERMTLSKSKIEDQISSILSQGHKRIIAVYGEHPEYDGEFIAKSIGDIYGVSNKGSSIKRVNINAAPMSVEDCKKVKAAGIGTYQIFQETYHQPTYRSYHPPKTSKGDYVKRLYALDNAFSAGIDDVGIGVLLGLYDWRYELLGLMSHVHHLENKFGVGPHTISFPRLCKADGVNEEFPYKVSDEDLKTIVAILRLAVPYVGLILTAREDSHVRDELIKLGVSQIDGGSRIDLDGYGHESKSNVAQFQLGDNRSLEEIISGLVDNKLIPSFCTGCYRKGRTGEHFMEFAIPGFIKSYCGPNALFTFMEYLTFYASDELVEKGHKLINEKLQQITDELQRNKIAEKLAEISDRKLNDYYF